MLGPGLLLVEAVAKQGGSHAIGVAAGGARVRAALPPLSRGAAAAAAGSERAFPPPSVMQVLVGLLRHLNHEQEGAGAADDVEEEVERLLSALHLLASPSPPFAASLRRALVEAGKWVGGGGR